MTYEILLVDDDPVVRSVIRSRFEEAGFLTLEAGSVEKALEVIERERGICAALVDDCLPRPVGLTLCRAIRARRPDIVVAYHSGQGMSRIPRDIEDDIAVFPKTMRFDAIVDGMDLLLRGRSFSAIGFTAPAQAHCANFERNALKAIGRGLHSRYDETLRERLPSAFQDVLARLN